MHESVQVLACPDQHGLFLHAQALTDAVRDTSADRPRDEEDAAVAMQGSAATRELVHSDSERPCPTCTAAMQQSVYAYDSGVHIDVCASHGIWLDADELHRIEAWYEAQHRIAVDDRVLWSGSTGRLEQIEELHEQRIANDHSSVHWGPVGRVAGSLAWWWHRRDDR